MAQKHRDRNPAKRCFSNPDLQFFRDMSPSLRDYAQSDVLLG